MKAGTYCWVSEDGGGGGGVIVREGEERKMGERWRRVYGKDERGERTERKEKVQRVREEFEEVEKGKRRCGEI